MPRVIFVFCTNNKTSHKQIQWELREEEIKKSSTHSSIYLKHLENEEDALLITIHVTISFSLSLSIYRSVMINRKQCHSVGFSKWSNDILVCIKLCGRQLFNMQLTDWLLCCYFFFFLFYLYIYDVCNEAAWQSCAHSAHQTTNTQISVCHPDGHE